MYRKIVEVEVRVKSCGNRSFCHGDGARVATDVDGSKSTRVATFSFRVILPSIDSRKKCIENATYQAFTIFAFISFPGSQGFFMETMFPEVSCFSLLNSIYIYILFAGEITWRRFSKLRTFSLLENENQCLKKCSIIGMLSIRTPISTTHLSS